MVEPLVLRLTLQRQAEQEVQKARHSNGNVLSGRPEDGVTRGPVGRLSFSKEKFSSATDLRRDPSTLTFGSGFSFAGRSRNEGLGRSGKAIASFLCDKLSRLFAITAPMTEGARSFRRRGTFAHRSPWSLVKSQDVGPAKSGQLNEAKATVLHLEVSTRAVFRAVKRPENYRHRSGRRAAVARRHRLPDLKIRGKQTTRRLREEPRRRCRRWRGSF